MRVNKNVGKWEQKLTVATLVEWMEPLGHLAQLIVLGHPKDFSEDSSSSSPHSFVTSSSLFWSIVNTDYWQYSWLNALMVDSLHSPFLQHSLDSLGMKLCKIIGPDNAIQSNLS